MSRGGFSDLEVRNQHVALWVCTAHVEKLFMWEYHPTLKKALSARLMEDFIIHIMAQSPTFIVI